MPKDSKSGDWRAPSVGGSSFMALLLISVSLVACGPEDYQKPVQQFREASAVLIATAQNFLGQMNRVEQDKELEQLVFVLPLRSCLWPTRSSGSFIFMPMVTR